MTIGESEHPVAMTRPRTSKLPLPRRELRSITSLLDKAVVEVIESAWRGNPTPLAPRAGTIIPEPLAPRRDLTAPEVIVDPQLHAHVLGSWAWQSGERDEITAEPVHSSRRWWYASGGVVASVVTMALILVFGGASSRKPAQIAAAPPRATAEVARPTIASEPVARPATPATPATVELGPPVVTNEPAAAPQPAAVEPVKPAAEAVKRARPRIDANAAYRASLQQFTRGDTVGAVSSLQALLASQPAHSPSWRTLGVLYEKLGEPARARDAYREYLRLAPDDGDALQIRERMARLGS